MLVFFTIAAAALLIASLGLLIAGFRGRQIDDHPVCRQCRFDLVGLVPGTVKCPECGSRLDVAHAIRIGNRRARPYLAASGFAIIACVIGAATWWLSGATGMKKVIRTLPSTTLVWLVQYTDSNAVIDELRDRTAKNTIDSHALYELAVRGLEYQANRARPWDPLHGFFIEAARQSKALSDEEWGVYAAQAVGQVRVRTNPFAIVGEPLPFQIVCSDFRVATKTALLVTIEPRRVVTSGGEFGLKGNRATSAPAPGPRDEIVWDSLAAKAVSLGPVPILVETEIRVSDSGAGPAVPIWRRQYTLANNAPAVALPLDTEITNRLTSSDGGPDIGVRGLDVGIVKLSVGDRTDPDRVKVYVALAWSSSQRSRFIPIAGDVYLVSRTPTSDGMRRELRVDQVNMSPGWFAGITTTASRSDPFMAQLLRERKPGELMPMVDVVIRPRSAAARVRVGTLTIWGADVILPQIPVSVEKASTPIAR